MATPGLSVWVVDDDESVRWVLEQALKQAHMIPRAFESGRQFFAALERDRPDVLVTDIRMPDMSGLELMERLAQSDPDIPVIVITAHSDLDSAVSAYQGGAFEYLPKPFDIDEAMELVSRAARQRTRGAAEQAQPKPTPRIIGQAPAMQDVFKAIGRLSRSSMTVLITGESGTGKELVARRFTTHSPRAAAPFVALNCGAIAETLLESELFGHEKGAFTGADRRSAHGLLRAGGRRHAVPRRDRRHAARAADEAPARARRSEFVRASAARPRSASTCASIAATHRDLVAMPSQRRPVPRGPLLPPRDVERIEAAAAASSAATTSASSHALLSRAGRERARRRPEDAEPRSRRGAAKVTTGRATFASS